MNERSLENHAVLLRFELDGRTFTEVVRRSEAMMVVASDPTRGYGRHSGFSHEVQNAAGDTLYRRIARGPTFPFREVSSPDGTMKKVTAPEGKRTVDSDTQMTATDPNGAGIVDITVIDPGGTSVMSAADQFTYV